MTPFPAASPDALITTGAPNSSIARSRVVDRRCTMTARAVGTPASTMSVFENAFDVSSIAAGARRPEDRQSRRAERVDDAGGERRLGPDERPVDAVPLAPSATSASTSVAATATHVASSAMPGLPGRGEELERRIFLSQAPGERVFAPATAHEQEPSSIAPRRC